MSFQKRFSYEATASNLTQQIVPFFTHAKTVTMEHFLILIILILILVILATVHINRLIFRASRPYLGGGVSHSSYSPPPATNRSGIIGIVVFISLTTLAYLSIPTHNIIDAANRQKSSELPDTRGSTFWQHQDSVEIDSGNISSPSDGVAQQTHGGHSFIDRNYHIERYNEHPSQERQVQFYVIQLEAFKLRTNAIKQLDKWLAINTYAHLIYVPGNSPFKLVIGDFSSFEAAERYRLELGLTEGFVKQVDYRPPKN